MKITADAHGAITYIAKPELSCLANETTVRKRASHIEPCRFALRVAFRVIRAIVPSHSPVACWTRRWPCRWRCNLHLSGGPVFGAFTDRQAAIDAEVEWLERNRI